MEQAIQIITREWEMISSFPISYIFSVLATNILIFLFIRWINKERFINLSGRLEFRDEQIKNLQKFINSNDDSDIVSELEDIVLRITKIEKSRAFKPNETAEGEHGENANGYYDRYKDGTQICKKIINVTEINGCIVFPAEFLYSPSLVVYPKDRIEVKKVTNNCFYYKLLSENSINSSLSYKAIGFWKV